MSSRSKPAKYWLIGSAALLLLVTVALLALWLMRPASDGWTCQWLGAPTILHHADRTECRGAVQCRHDTIRTFVPRLRRVTCPAQGSDCDPTTCFTSTIRTP